MAFFELRQYRTQPGQRENWVIIYGRNNPTISNF